MWKPFLFLRGEGTICRYIEEQRDMWLLPFLPICCPIATIYIYISCRFLIILFTISWKAFYYTIYSTVEIPSINVLKYWVYLRGFNKRRKVSTIVKKKFVVSAATCRFIIGIRLFIGRANFFWCLFPSNNSKAFIYNKTFFKKYQNYVKIQDFFIYK